MPKADNRTISLSSELAAAVDEAVEAGAYGNASEVIGEALREWKERRDLFGYSRDELRRLIQEEIDSGPAEPWDREAFLAKARQRLAERQSRKAG
ncbi:type II toxin-antitoxin system ParD family antitoxin [Aurantimonas sp. VKM B-3413]|uniref:type II toxin-antitoxin system ParD family antitoxin n=1 Tax=Aurantimonas sp. VKM B-3413 TaxID=2779401 RepID=UPI001E286E7A|nr:type II toxin-antitoxin system ParD family antitoxin [Aurantimonas sp. VKM B-3413]MCB8836992.1 type II toxin-antitoxin system ParD family antitoxin [Aurantimonas sp. VKM B-3413]